MVRSSHQCIRVVTFDLDDTLWAVEPLIVNAERLMWAWLERHCPRMTAHYDLAGLGELRNRVLEHHPLLAHDISGQRLRVLALALEDSGYNHRASSRLAAGAFAVFMEARHDVRYFDRALEVLTALNREYSLGVLSNGNADVRRLEIGRFFDFAISAAALASSKPAPHMFQAALRATGCRPHEMVHVGDHHEHDVAGAQELGIHTVWVNHERGPFPGEHPASAEITALEDLPRALAGIARAAPVNRRKRSG